MKWIIILGMHRSGTSALAGELQHQGVCFGESFIDDVEDVNKKGFYEHKTLVDINEQILRELNSTWYNCFKVHKKISKGWLPQQSTINAIQNFLQSDEFKTTSINGLKDPRLSLLLPIWTKQLELLGFSYNCIIVNRSPSKIASSLKKRDRMNNCHCYLLWEYYTICSFLYSTHCKKVVIDSDDLLTNPKNTLQVLIEELAIDINYQDVRFIDMKIPSSVAIFDEPELYLKLKSSKDPINDLDWNSLIVAFDNYFEINQLLLSAIIDSFIEINDAWVKAINNGSVYSYAISVIQEKDAQISKKHSELDKAINKLNSVNARIERYESSIIIKLSLSILRFLKGIRNS